MTCMPIARNERIVSPSTDREAEGLAEKGTSPSMLWNGRSAEGYTWAIRQGDAAEVLKQLPREHVNCAVTSPPYFWLRDYGIDGQIGQEETVDEYINSLLRVMSELKGVLRPDGLLFLNMGDTFYSGKGESRGRDKKAKRGISG